MTWWSIAANRFRYAYGFTKYGATWLVPAHRPTMSTLFSVIARLVRAIQNSRSMITGSPGQAGR